MRDPVVLAQGADGVAPAPMWKGPEGLRNGGPCGSLGLEGVGGRETCLPRLKGMGNGSFCSDVIQSGLGDKEKVACKVLPSRSPVHSEGASRAIILCTAATGRDGRRGDVLLRNTTCAHTAMPAGSPTYSKGANRTFAVCADATRKGRREGHELLHRNTYECPHIDDDVCDTYIYSENSKQTARPTFPERELRCEQPERYKKPDVGQERL